MQCAWNSRIWNFEFRKTLLPLRNLWNFDPCKRFRPVQKNSRILQLHRHSTHFYKSHHGGDCFFQWFANGCEGGFANGSGCIVYEGGFTDEGKDRIKGGIWAPSLYLCVGACPGFLHGLGCHAQGRRRHSQYCCRHRRRDIARSLQQEAAQPLLWNGPVFFHGSSPGWMV